METHKDTTSAEHIAKPALVDAEAVRHGDVSAQLIGNERVTVTEEDNKRIRRQTDKVILVILVWVYFLQILDKTVLGYAATYGLKEANHLVGNQYSLVGSIQPIAQLAWLPFSSFLVVRVPHRILMPVLILGWGIAETSIAACSSFSGLLAARFFLGLFEAGCLPMFSVITSQWYRRAEQPLRVAAWYGTNGIAASVAAALSYGLAHIRSPLLESWQIIFLVVGLLTIVSSPFVYWKLDNDIPSARFLSEEDKPKAIERLRANQTGTGSREFKWKQILELILDLKTWIWLAMATFINVGAGVTNIFGPLIVNGLGFDKYTTSLLNIPYGFILWAVTMIVSWACQRFRSKFVIMMCTVLPVIAGLAILYAVPRDGHTGALLTGYYLLSFLYGSVIVQISWMVANTAGSTKKSAVMSVYNAAASTGSIVGPLLFTDKDAPQYLPGLRIVLGFFIAIFGITVIQALYLAFLNKLQERRRVRNGKPAKIKDTSMERKYRDMEEPTGGVLGAEDAAERVSAAEQGIDHSQVGKNAFLDLTDRENDEFVYVL
ncbi:major facilitator superfamily domain-containing protein [Xylariaceae sp. FL1272]|nr:major facilitator superfamily domain-containing protein [Xylariaceae sp. FL1272]